MKKDEGDKPKTPARNCTFCYSGLPVTGTCDICQKDKCPNCAYRHRGGKCISQKE